VPPEIRDEEISGGATRAAEARCGDALGGRPAARRRRPALAALLAAAALAAPPARAAAQEAPPPAQRDGLRLGEAYSTRFSGTIEVVLADGTPLTLIDRAGAVGSVVDLRRPGFSADGRHWRGEPQRAAVTAGEVGQVFGIAIDDAEPPNVYLAATSAFGLRMFSDERDWLPGQWGAGGPGGVYRLDGARGLAPALFAIVGADGRRNSGAALGGIAFDGVHRQLFVSDLETGLVHRLALDGAEIGRFDHGVDGRARYLDAPSGATVRHDPVPFDAASAARPGACADEAGAPAAFAATPSCWNFADFRRRVWGLAVHRDAETGETRLYYAVWGAAAFGDPAWGGEEARNAVWSVALDDGGGFDLGRVRREFALPAATDDPDVARAVSDLEVSAEGVMLVAERGVRTKGLGAGPFAAPLSARVLRYVRDDAGTWRPDGRYDVGFDDRARVGPPFIRAGAAGGADFGYGYDAPGTVDLGRPDGVVWMTGDALCSPAAACLEPSTGERIDGTAVFGLQGTPVEDFAAVAPAGAGAAPARDVDSADVLLASYLIDLRAAAALVDGAVRAVTLNDALTMVGDVEVRRSALAAPAGTDGAPACPPGAACDEPVADGEDGDPPEHEKERSHLKDGSTEHEKERSHLKDGSTEHEKERSHLKDGSIGHEKERSHLKDGSIEHEKERSHLKDGSIEHEKERSHLKDGSTEHEKERSHLKDGSTEHEKERSHLKDGSTEHEKERSHLKDGSTEHEKERSHLKDGSTEHEKERSHLKDGSTEHEKERSHLKDGSTEHEKERSHLKDGSIGHEKERSHLKDGSIGHEKERSHLKDGSTEHEKERSHLKDGSTEHEKERSHLKDGSTEHEKERSHLKDGSTEHEKERSHLKDGSTEHEKERSHLKDGSIGHEKERSHLKDGSIGHEKERSHLKDGSIGHEKERSHLKDGSIGHEKERSHLKDGSIRHEKERSHLKDGSIEHEKERSHLKDGSTEHEKEPPPEEIEKIEDREPPPPPKEIEEPEDKVPPPPEDKVPPPPPKEIEEPEDRVPPPEELGEPEDKAPPPPPPPPDDKVPPPRGSIGEPQKTQPAAKSPAKPVAKSPAKSPAKSSAKPSVKSPAKPQKPKPALKPKPSKPPSPDRPSTGEGSGAGGGGAGGGGAGGGGAGGGGAGGGGAGGGGSGAGG